MKTTKLKTMFFVTLCLLIIFNPVPVLPSLSTSPISLEPLVENSQGWDNAWTETIFGNGTPPFKTIVYSHPQVIWNGTQWVKYEITIINETAVILRTPTCAYLVGELAISLLDPNGTLPVGGMQWIVEQYSEALEVGSKLVKTASVGYNNTHVWQKWTFMDDSERILYIGCDNKQTVVFTPKSSATCRLVWRFTNINASGIVYQNGTCIKLDEGCEYVHKNFNVHKLAFFEEQQFLLSIQWPEIPQSFYRELILRRPKLGCADLSLAYGNWTLDPDEPLIIDPETQTFSSEDELDGTIMKLDTFYPPSYALVWSGEIWVGQYYDGYYYWVFRGYASFDTSSIRDYSVILNATLKIKAKEDHSTVDFATKVMGGSQPIYGSSLETADWNCGTTEVATWSSSQYPGDGIYVNITIPKDQINTTGRTQFELKSNREGTQPVVAEYIIFYDEPQLEITWLPHTQKIGSQWWYYWNSTTNEKAAIILFGGVASSSWVEVLSLFFDGYAYGNYIVQNYYPYYKEKFVVDLYSNGYDVLSPKNDTNWYTDHGEASRYGGTQDWVKNASTWLVEKGYRQIFLFGFSAGGVVAAYEIQKDYASVFSAAVIADAPVDYDTYGDIFNSADTASQVKVCTSIIVGKEDMALGNITEQMKHYYDNTVVHKEWHLWEDGHDPFPNHCWTHPGETVFDVVYNWYQHTHNLTIGTSSSSVATQYPFQRKTFYANGRYWMFYSDGTNMVYRTSTNSSTWTTATTVRTCTSGTYFSTWFNGTYLHYAYAFPSDNTPLLYYRRGTPNADGSITWSTAQEQIARPAYTYTSYWCPFVSVDSASYPFIGYTQRVYIPGIADYYNPYVTKSNKTDGTWMTASGFPYGLSATSAFWSVSIIPLTAGKMYAVYARSGAVGYGRLWTGSSWGSEEATSSSTFQSGYYHSAVAYGDDVHLVFLKSSTYNIIYRKRTYGVGWGTEATIQSATTSTSAPVLSVNSANGNLYCFWAGSPTANHIYYKKRIGGTWDANPTDWINESAEVLTGNDCLTCFYKVQNNAIGLAYMTKTTPQYNIKYAKS